MPKVKRVSLSGSNWRLNGSFGESSVLFILLSAKQVENQLVTGEMAPIEVKLKSTDPHTNQTGCARSTFQDDEIAAIRVKLSLKPLNPSKGAKQFNLFTRFSSKLAS